MFEGCSMQNKGRKVKGENLAHALKALDVADLRAESNVRIGLLHLTLQKEECAFGDFKGHQEGWPVTGNLATQLGSNGTRRSRYKHHSTFYFQTYLFSVQLDSTAPQNVFNGYFPNLVTQGAMAENLRDGGHRLVVDPCRLTKSGDPTHCLGSRGGNRNKDLGDPLLGHQTLQ